MMYLAYDTFLLLVLYDKISINGHHYHNLQQKIFMQNDKGCTQFCKVRGRGAFSFQKIRINVPFLTMLRLDSTTIQKITKPK